MSLTYSIADLHGRYDLLLKALTAISEDAEQLGKSYKVVTLGDYVDRGPDSAKIIQHLIDAQAAGRPLICLKGNHEDILLQACSDPRKLDWWGMNGGNNTLRSYGTSDALLRQAGWKPGEVEAQAIPQEHKDWLAELPMLYFDKHRVFVHGGVDPEAPLDNQHLLRDPRHGEPLMLWKLYGKNDEGGHKGRHVVHGHHQHEDGPVVKNNRTNLDTLAWATGRLVVGVFDDEKPGGAAGFLEIRGNRHPDF